MFPNFSFLDAPFNKQYYKPGHPETECAYMGCRTRVIGNHYDPTREIVNGRGNLSFTSINLPRIAIRSHGDLSTGSLRTSTARSIWSSTSCWRDSVFSRLRRCAIIRS